LKKERSFLKTWIRFSLVLVTALTAGSCANGIMDDLEKDIQESKPAVTFSVTYNGNGATGGDLPVDTARYEEGETVTVLGSGNLVKTGYIFFHWNTKSNDSGTSYTAGPTLIMPGENLTLWAIWTELPSYTVSFDSQGGSAVSAQTVLEGGTVIEPADPSREGYSFGGWFKEALCNNPWNFSSDTITANRTLYAKWTAETFTVLFDELGGSAPDPSYKIVTFGSAYGTLPTTAKRDYIFEGWWTGTNGTGTQVTELTAVATASNHTLYARWGWEDYNLKDLGPAQGWVFYINPNALTDGWKYLLAATGDLTSRAWGTYNHTVAGADGTALDTGEQNTLDIISGDSLADKAADECADYSFLFSGYTYDDYYLPSREELDLMYEELYLKSAGFFNGTAYWCSSESSAYSAWAQDFTDGTQNAVSKSSVLSVRPIRKY